MDRRALVALAGLALLSVAVMLGSVMTALAAFEDQEVQYSATDIPEALLDPEPIDAVRHKPTTPDLIAAIVESPVPSAPAPLVTPKAPIAPSQRASTPPVAVPRFEISMSSAAKGRGGNRTISYDITIRNVGEASLAGLVVRSHVPSGTSWVATPSCDRNGHEVVLTYPDAKERLCVGGPQTISGDPDSHPVEVTLKTMTPGMTAVVSFTVDAPGGNGTIENHAHLSGIGVEMQSASTAESAAAAQESAESNR